MFNAPLSRCEEFEHGTELQSRLEEFGDGVRVFDDSRTGKEVSPGALDQTATEADRELALPTTVEPADTAGVPTPVVRLGLFDEIASCST